MASFCTENGTALLVRHPSVACEKARRFGLSEVYSAALNAAQR
jgi:hypothetical protein